MKELYKVPGKVVGHHHPDINAIVDTWDSMAISLEEWKSTIFEIGIMDYAPKHGVTTWVIDTRHSSGIFYPEVQEFREKVAAQKLVENGVRFLFVIQSRSVLGKSSGRKTTELYSKQNNLISFQVASIEEALDIVKEEENSMIQ